MQHLDETELQELSLFFARRFPGRTARQPLAMAAGLNFEESGNAATAWYSLLSTAQSTGRLSLLATAAARTLRSDDNLQEACALLGGTAPRPFAAPLAFASGIACAVVLFVLILRLTGGGTDAAPPPAPDVPGLVSVSAAPVPLPTVESPSLSATRATVSPPAPPTTTEAVAVVPAPEQAPAPPPAAQTGYRAGCSAAPGELVGYFYAGAEPIGRAGQTITVPETMNVRADYPDFRNGHNAKAAVQCVIRRGQQLRLSADPVRVPGDRYWVPVYGDDLR